MEDKSSKNPLRQSTNKAKDLYNAYFKNEGTRNIPISDHEDKKQNETNKGTMLNEEEIENIIKSATDELSENYEQKIAELELKIMDLEKERDDFKEQNIRRTAEFDNFRKRTLREKEDLINYANEKLLNKFLVLLDDINSAVESGSKSEDYSSLYTGINLISQKAIKLFEESGIKRIQTEAGDIFDVELHEALVKIPSEFEEDHIVQIIQSGYTLNDKVIRHAKVITSAGPANN
ncbi:MAG: nucleotide exchange factor GrpE [Candidatus Kapabacteria bacterium]|nr:nucleotide exchange factor GrpE [Candidatus Kapabacteria bacterium]